MGFDKTGKLFERGTIEIAPLAYMRGRTLNHSFIILDEAQNTTPEQMKMFLTRIGFGTKSVITGDVTQIDLARGQKSGLVEADRILAGVRGIAFTRFTSADVVRHPLVQKIIGAYERDIESRKGGRHEGGARRDSRSPSSTASRRPKLPCARGAAALGEGGDGARGDRDAALRRQARRPDAERALPRQGVRHQRARLPVRCVGADRGRHRPLRPRGARGGPRAGQDARRSLRASRRPRHAPPAGLRSRHRPRRAHHGGARDGDPRRPRGSRIPTRAARRRASFGRPGGH